jgi:hypothetical protein
MYRREGELEGEVVARKGRDEEVYQEGDDDDLMGIETEDKDIQIGSIMKDVRTQKMVSGKDISCQIGRKVEKVSQEDQGMIASGSYLNIRAGRRANDITHTIGNLGFG